MQMRIAKSTTSGINKMVQNLNDIDPIVLRLENMNVKRMFPLQNEPSCFMIVEQEHFSKKQNTKTVISRAQFNTDEVEKIGEFIGDL